MPIRSAVAELRSYLRACIEISIQLRERSKALAGLAAAFIALPVVWFFGGKLELTEKGIYWLAAWVSAWAFVLLFVISPFLLWRKVTAAAQPPTRGETAPMLLLTPVQQKLLGLIFAYQDKFALRKLVIGRTSGELFQAGGNEKVFLAREVFDREPIGDEFDVLVDSIPPEYLRFFSEALWDSPYVVSLTDAGKKYLIQQNEITDRVFAASGFGAL